MAQEKSKSFRNSVRLVGYLKETTLEERVAQNGKHFITGKVIVAVNEFNTQRVSFLVFEEDNKEKYDALKKFLPENTISIASYIKSTENKANFATATGMAAKVWVMAGFEEFVSRSGEREKTMINLKGFSMGACDPDKTFNPTAEFEVDCYFESLTDEVENDEPTGRLLVNVIVPAYKELVYRIPMVAPVEDNVAKYLKGQYKVGDTARIKGQLVAMKVEIANDNEEETECFGKQMEKQVTTRFIRENVILSGPKKPIEQGAEGSITTEMVKKGLALRETLMDENGQKRAKAIANKENNQEEPAEKPAPVKQKLETAPAQDGSSANPEDLDF